MDDSVCVQDLENNNEQLYPAFPIWWGEEKDKQQNFISQDGTWFGRWASSLITPWKPPQGQKTVLLPSLKKLPVQISFSCFPLLNIIAQLGIWCKSTWSEGHSAFISVSLACHPLSTSKPQASIVWLFFFLQNPKGWLFPWIKLVTN